jgi:hypothetical protein
MTYNQSSRRSCPDFLFIRILGGGPTKTVSAHPPGAGCRRKTSRKFPVVCNLGGDTSLSPRAFRVAARRQDISLPYACWVVATPAGSPFSHFLRPLQRIYAIRTLGGEHACTLLFGVLSHQWTNLQAIFGRSLTELGVGNTTTQS